MIALAEYPPSWPNWIPVEDRLPPDGEFVLVTVAQNFGASGVGVAAIFGGRLSTTSEGTGTVTRVTHWMPMPEAAK
jgi:hypothetical protein